MVQHQEGRRSHDPASHPSPDSVLFPGWRDMDDIQSSACSALWLALKTFRAGAWQMTDPLFTKLISAFPTSAEHCFTTTTLACKGYIRAADAEANFQVLVTLDTSHVCTPPCSLGSLVGFCSFLPSAVPKFVKIGRAIFLAISCMRYEQ